MVRRYTYPNEDVAPWEPEPLYLPVEQVPPDKFPDQFPDQFPGQFKDKLPHELYDRRNRMPAGNGENRDDKPTGSHVIVVDLW